MPSPAVDLLAALADAFASLGTPWYLFGAQAVVLYGAPRLTADADVTVSLGDIGIAHLIAELEEHGFTARTTDLAFIEQQRVVPIVHAASGIPVDVVLAGPGLEEVFLSRVNTITLEGVAIPVLAVEDLIAVKVLAGRPQDLLDVESLLQVKRSTIGLELVRSTLRILEDALARSDLLPALDDLVARSGGSNP